MGCFNTAWAKAKAKVQSWHKTEFIPDKVRGPIFGNIITLSIAECAAYRIITQDVRVGNLPPYIPYLLISLVAMFESILGPLVAWFGYNTRKRMMLCWSIGVILASFAWFLMPQPDSLEESEFCYSNNTSIVFTELSARTAVRVSVTIFVAICFCLARVASWSHYIAYTDEHEPNRTSIHFGLLVIARVIPLIFGYKTLSVIVEINVMFKILIITISTLLNTANIYFDIPTSLQVNGAAKEMPPRHGRGFFTSLFRVLCNVLAMSQMMSMGLLVAAFWGFGYNKEEIVKTNFNLQRESQFIDDHAEFLYYFIAIVSVVYVGVKHSSPIRSEYEINRGLKHIFKMTLVAIVAYILITVVPSCKKGHIAGLEDGNMYANPQCSLACGCVPKWREYSPVCVVDTMTTYLSPCEAGCTGSSTIDELKVYTNCSCAGPSGRAAPGACSDQNCQSGLYFHQATFTIILTVSVLAFQTQGMVILKSVDPRDKSIAVGMMWSVVATVAYVCGNNIFFSIAVKSCSWYTGEKCQLYGQRYSYLIGFTCAGLAFIALAINLVARGYMQVRNRHNTNNTTPTHEIASD